MAEFVISTLPSDLNSRLTVVVLLSKLVVVVERLAQLGRPVSFVLQRFYSTVGKKLKTGQHAFNR